MAGLGRVIGGKYRLLHEIGRGGMGTVWAAEHAELAMMVAVKFIDPRLLDDWRAHQRFVREARAAAAVRGPHVVQVLDHGQQDGGPYIVMELLDGETLAARIQREERLAPPLVDRVISQAARAVARAHELGFVHRDLKPSNIFLTDDEDPFVVKVLDFGIAKALKLHNTISSHLTDKGALLGTLQYMSPEQIRGEDVTGTSDIWTLGVVAFECLIGLAPFPGRNPGELMKQICSQPMPVPSTFADVPASFDAWFARAAAREPAERFPTSKELSVSLSAVLDEMGSAPCQLTPTGLEVLGNPRRELKAYSTTRFPRTRKDDRIASSVPAAINGQRDLEHVAVVVNISRSGALLWTRFRCEVGETIDLSIYFDDSIHGLTVPAVVVRVQDRPQSSRQLWLSSIAVRFLSKITGLDEKLSELRQAARSHPPE